MALPENWHHLSHDYSSENTNEDPRMMAFFDNLIQQEVEEWETNSSTDVSQAGDRSISSFFSCGSTSSNSSNSTSNSESSSTSSSSSSSSSSSDSDNDNENNNNELINNTKRSKRRTVLSRKAERRERNNKRSKLDKIITKKSSTLRQIAITPTSINKKRKSKNTAVSKGRKRTNSNKRQHQASVRKKSVRNSRTTNNSVNDRPTTSAAAVAALTESSRFDHNNTQNKNTKSSKLINSIYIL